MQLLLQGETRRPRRGRCGFEPPPLTALVFAASTFPPIFPSCGLPCTSDHDEPMPITYTSNNMMDSRAPESGGIHQAHRLWPWFSLHQRLTAARGIWAHARRRSTGWVPRATDVEQHQAQLSNLPLCFGTISQRGDPQCCGTTATFAQRFRKWAEFEKQLLGPN